MSYKMPVSYPFGGSSSGYTPSMDVLATGYFLEKREVKRKPIPGDVPGDDGGRNAMRTCSAQAMLPLAGEHGDSKRPGFVFDKQEKALGERAQYEHTRSKLDDQLLKLKEQREELKANGAKHEDDIMRENAKLQKEAKGRIAQVDEILDKLKGLQSFPLDSSSHLRPSGVDLQSKKVRATSRSLSPEEKEEKEKAGGGKKKKKRRNKSPSSSDSDSEHETAKKKSRKRKKKKSHHPSSSSSPSESDEDGSNVKKTKKKKHRRNSIMTEFDAKRGEEGVVELLERMSDAFIKTKQHNMELTHRVQALESENVVLKRQLLQIKTSADDSLAFEGKKGKKDAEKKAELFKKVHELLASKPTHEVNVPTALQSTPKRHKDSDKENSTSSAPRPDKNSRINLADWNQAPRQPDMSPTLTSLREKMAQKEERERAKEADQKRFASSLEKEAPDNEKNDQTGGKLGQACALLPPERAQVSLQLTKASKKTQDSASSVKRALPVIGKMPGRSKKSAEREGGRLGSAPPEEQRPAAPAKPSAMQAAAMQAMYGGLTPEMYMQAINATMPAEPPGQTVFDLYQMFPPRPPPKHPTPTNMELSDILAAAKAHMQKQQEQPPPPPPPPPGKEEDTSESPAIPLPPLPAAVDKDPNALIDTRPPKPPTPPPPPQEKTEMELMIEKHQQTDRSDAAPPPPPPPEPSWPYALQPPAPPM